MNTHRVVPQAGVYRIETVTGTGRHWLLRKVYFTEEAAMTRVRALLAMAEADLPERRPAERPSCASHA